MPKTKHILLIRLSALGDVAMTVPVVKVLSETYPKLRITVLSRPEFKPLFEEISNINFIGAEVYGAHKGFFGLIKLARVLRKLGIDAVADFHDVIRTKTLRKNLWFSGLRMAHIDKGGQKRKNLPKPKEWGWFNSNPPTSAMRKS